MLKHPLSWLLTGVILLGAWWVPMPPALAGKKLDALTFTGLEERVAVVSVYETSYGAQKSIVKSLKVPNKLMKKVMGFQGSAVLQSQDGMRVIAFSQWQDLASYQAYQPPATPTVAPPNPTQTRFFQIAAGQVSIPGATPALRGKQAVVQWIELTPKTAEARSPILSQVESLLPSLLTQQPIPQSVLLLTGLDHDAIALMMNWNCSALFEDVGQPGAIAIPPELAALADQTQQLYKVAALIPASLPEPEDEAN